MRLSRKIFKYNRLQSLVIIQKNLPKRLFVNDGIIQSTTTEEKFRLQENDETRLVHESNKLVIRWRQSNFKSLR